MSLAVEELNGIIYQSFGVRDKNSFVDLEKDFIDEAAYLIDNVSADEAASVLVRARGVIKKNLSRCAGTPLQACFAGLLDSVNTGLKLVSLSRCRAA